MPRRGARIASVDPNTRVEKTSCSDAPAVIGYNGMPLAPQLTQLGRRRMVTTVRYQKQTFGQGDVRDVKSDVAAAVSTSGLAAGLATVPVVGLTAAVTTIAFEPGAVEDFTRLFETLAPRDGFYRHHERWDDDNGSSHVCAALLGPSLTVPFSDSELLVGMWQQVVLVEFDT